MPSVGAAQKSVRQELLYLSRRQLALPANAVLRLRARAAFSFLSNPPLNPTPRPAGFHLARRSILEGAIMSNVQALKGAI